MDSTIKDLKHIAGRPCTEVSQGRWREILELEEGPDSDGYKLQEESAKKYGVPFSGTWGCPMVNSLTEKLCPSCYARKALKDRGISYILESIDDDG